MSNTKKFRSLLVHAVTAVVVSLIAFGAAAADDREACAKGSGDVAIAGCTQAIASGKYKGLDLSKIYYNRAIAHAAKGDKDYERAIADYSEAIRLDPNYAAAFFGRAELYIHKVFNCSPSPTPDDCQNLAIADYGEAIRLDSKYAAAFFGRGEVYMRYTVTPDRAIPDYDQAIRLKPDHALAFYGRGAAYYRTRQYDRAIQDFDQAIRLKPDDNRGFEHRGQVYIIKGEYDSAIQDFDQAIRIYPNGFLAFYYRGRAYQKKGEYDRAIQDFDQAIRLFPYAFTFHDRGAAYYSKGEYDRAIADYDEAIRLDPKFAQFALAFVDRGDAYYQKGEYDRAVADYSEAIRLDPKHAVGYRMPGDAAFDKKEGYERAIALYGRGAAKLKQGDGAGGNADIAAAKAIRPEVAEEYAKYGLSAPDESIFYRFSQLGWLWVLVIGCAAVVSTSCFWWLRHHRKLLKPPSPRKPSEAALERPVLDYYVMLDHAIQRLDRNAAETRAAVYARARRALSSQLRTMNPPWSEVEVERAHQALQEAIQQIEAEQSRAARHPNRMHGQVLG